MKLTGKAGCSLACAQILELPRQASKQDIQKSYRRLASAWWGAMFAGAELTRLAVCLCV